MSKGQSNRRAANEADLHEFSNALSRMLHPLLLSGDWEALCRWCKARTWIDNATEGEAAPDLTVMELAVAYLAEQVANGERGGG